MAGLKAIYNPKGHALEYGAWALNIYNGCIHACKYCYGIVYLTNQRRSNMKNEKTEQMTPASEAQLAGEISEMLTKATDKVPEQLEILQAVLGFCAGPGYLIIEKNDFISLSTHH